MRVQAHAQQCPATRSCIGEPRGFGRGVVLACALVVFCTPAAGQAPIFEGKPVVAIQYTPAQPLDPQDLQHAQILRLGDPFKAEDVARAIDRLFATGRFEDIVVEAEPSGEGVLVRFRTTNTRFIGGMAPAGKIASPPNEGQIVSTAGLILGAPFQEADLQNAVDAVKRLLDANGLYEAVVQPSLQGSKDAQQIFITFTIEEHKRAKYTFPTVRGGAGLDDNTLLRTTGWRIPIIHWWRQVTASRTQKGVQRLQERYAQKDQLEAKVKVENINYDQRTRRVSPDLSVDPGPKIKITAVEAKVSRRVLKKYVPVFTQGSLDDDLLIQGKRNLQDYFQARGYYDVDIDFRRQPVQNNTQTIEYAIAKGQRYKLVHIAVIGNKYFKPKDIRERMFMQPATFSMRRGRYSEAFQRKDEENIADLYRTNGFRNVKVVCTVDRKYKGKTGDIAVTVNIMEGPQWIVDKLTLRGVAGGRTTALLQNLASVAGQPFADLNLAFDRRQVLTYYYTQGFPSAQFQASWHPVVGAPNHVTVLYTVSEGRQQYVREVLTAGVQRTRKNIIDRQITLKTGDPLSPVQETDIQKRFYDLGIFARVDTAIENPDGDEEHKYVLYDFEEAKRYTLTVGLGAQIGRFGTPSTTSVTAPGGSTGFSPSISVDVSRLNVLGRAHTVTLGALYSSLEKRGSASYLIPRFLNNDKRTITYSVLYDNSLNVNTFASKREEGSVQISQTFTKTLTGLLRFAYRDVSVSSVIIPTLLVPQLLQPVRIGMLSANLVQDRRDNAADPHKGMYNTADIGVAGRFFGSQRSFGRVLLRNATYYRLSRNLVLARQTQFGVITPFAAPAGLSEQESVPLPERFFGGGADSLRAFPFNQAGPRDTGAPLVPGEKASQPTGFPLGGNALLFNNVEFRFPMIGDNIQGVLFHDMGNIYSTLSDLSFRFHQRDLQDFNYAVQAAGFGIRYRTPLGPIRLDLAYSINTPSYIGFQGTPQQLLECGTIKQCASLKQSISHFQFFFSIGQAF